MLDPALRKKEANTTWMSSGLGCDDAAGEGRIGDGPVDGGPNDCSPIEGGSNDVGPVAGQTMLGELLARSGARKSSAHCSKPFLVSWLSEMYFTSIDFPTLVCQTPRKGPFRDTATASNAIFDYNTASALLPSKASASCGTEPLDSWHAARSYYILTESSGKGSCVPSWSFIGVTCTVLKSSVEMMQIVAGPCRWACS
ncbi:uncharacterized protein M421DRAFT_229121 [Didymella exigua CBS 183.55]|uniref:Uncharacterized protein n=1 Tax=Didymella exigua CBS 183.55 TaxID=1150837 RepID=A0A6A5RE90_9PLEO|nr:uncharacterized protein M421DRAFT_229121 [Didymella exigua CBS 183.55]KAF1925982.1 hypothetical protein M421DRAFT_229121 [Didymella exigua CBS 183.55]